MAINPKDKIIQKLMDSSSSIKCYHDELPLKYQKDKDIISIERQVGLRQVGRRGYDVINGKFFVHEIILKRDYNSSEEKSYEEKTEFRDFESYYNYLDGDIYNNACYYQCAFNNVKHNVDFDKLKSMKSFITATIDDFSVTPSQNEINHYQKVEDIKPEIKDWLTTFNDCTSFEKLSEVVEKYDSSILKNEYSIDLLFFLWNYIFYDINDEKRFKIIMKYISAGMKGTHYLLRPLCHVFNPEEVILLFDPCWGCKQTRDKYKRELKEYVSRIKKAELKISSSVYFDKNTHYYCECTSFGNCFLEIHRYFETIEGLISYREGDLFNADFRQDIELKYDFSNCKTYNTTLLPASYYNKFQYYLKKEYSDGRFVVEQSWDNPNIVRIKHYKHEFEYFFDFIFFLKNDLSDADLLQCDGLKNLIDSSEINFDNSKLSSKLSKKFGVESKKYTIDKSKLESFSIAEENEKKKANRWYCIPFNSSDTYLDRFYYITDIHILHKLAQAKVKSVNDVESVINSIVDIILLESGRVVLIGGDVSSDYSIFEMFVKTLKTEMDRKKSHKLVIFVLGNHELWDFPQLSFEQIVTKYQTLLETNGMYLLQNSIIYLEKDYARWVMTKINIVTEKELLSFNTDELRKKLQTARTVIFGGLAFSGYACDFNADMGIYRQTIDRTTEIKETKKFENLYEQLLPAMYDKNVIVFTHTPMNCWRKTVKYESGFVYVSGHNHQREFYDDGDIRVYADNQIGYHDKSIHLKFFEMDNEYDYFSDYADGIYKITPDDYRIFYRGKNLQLTFNRQIHILYMLKKNSYYCFIHESKGGSLTILNGGSLQKLYHNSVSYYYKNMDSVIANIESPLKKYTEYQERIASEIRKIGGAGIIHGCIIDIDWFNHVYVNPIDLKITGYWASDIINKKVYPNVVLLLKNECPTLYRRYSKLLEGSSKELPILASEIKAELDLLPQEYFETDIYKASREVKKMQKLSSNILSFWNESINDNKLIE